MSAQDPTHPAAGLRDDLEEVGWTVNEFATRLGVSRNTDSRLLNGRCAISPEVALALERIGWSDADFCTRRQASYDLAMARRAQEAAPRRGIAVQRPVHPSCRADRAERLGRLQRMIGEFLSVEVYAPQL
ncbi:MAG: HigA family addiction module antitoxin [Chloroflexota bacterium]|nr:HigA family addiction module antitoxin [Chloroflexota bacterium]